jgi:hypothetical protein
MRKELQKKNKERIVIFATVSRFGTKSNWHGFPEPTICFNDVRDSEGDLLTDHIWFTVRKRISDLNLVEGDRISFEARIGE